MLRFTILLALLTAWALPASAQPNTDEDGFYYSSGPVYNGENLTGYFTLQIGRVDDEILKYTIKLLDRNADQIGKTVYQRKNAFNLHRIVYNGTHLALLLQEEDNPPYIDILDGSGERVRRKTFDHSMDMSVRTLWPTEGGFVYSTNYQYGTYKKTDLYRWTIGFIPNTEAADDTAWTVESGKEENSNVSMSFLASSPDRLLFQESYLDKSVRRAVPKFGLLSIDPASGERLFDNTRSVEDYHVYDAAHIGESSILTYRVEEDETYFGQGDEIRFTVHEYSLSGERTDEHEFTVAEIIERGADKKQAKEFKYSTWFTPDYSFAPDGRIQVAVERVRQSGNNVLFQEARSLVFSPDGELLHNELVKRPEYALAMKHLGAINTLPVLSRRGQDLIQNIQFHGGPLCFAGQQNFEDGAIQFFYDRTFSKEGVEYRSIQALIYYDGEMVQETIPFTSEADMVRIYPGKEGYFLVMEAFSDGSINTRLERLDF